MSEPEQDRIELRLSRQEKDWVLKRVLDGIADVEERPAEESSDKMLLDFLKQLRDKLYRQPKG